MDSAPMHGLNDTGVLYVATVETRYVEEAFLSAASVKKHCPALSVTLFTDQPDHDLCKKAVFDQVLPVARCFDVRLPWAAGQLNRLHHLRRTPYLRTLHLDTDTFVLTPEIGDLFSILDNADVAMVEATISASRCRAYLGKSMFNSGVLLFRKNKIVDSFLTQWIALTERNFRLGARAKLPRVSFLAHVKNEEKRRFLLFSDQTSLTDILSPDTNLLDLRREILDSCWNSRTTEPQLGDGRSVKILHPPRNLGGNHSRNLELALNWLGETSGSFSRAASKV